MIDQSMLRQLLAGYLEGRLSREETGAFFGAVADPANDAMLQSLLAEVWEETGGEEDAVPSPESLRRIGRTLNRARPVVRRRLYWPWVAAACVLLAVATGIYTWYRPQQETPAALYTLVAGLGEKKNVTLPDGTSVTLNAGSELQYGDFRQGGIRSVTLKGEAYFDVAQDAKRPFIVASGGLRAEVLGTSFGFRNYADETGISVSVSSGRVRVLQGARALGELVKNERIVYRKTTGEHSLQTFDIHKNWKDGFLEFNGEPLPEVLAVLGRTFNKKIVAASGIPAGLQIRASFHESQGLPKILGLICKLHDLGYTEKKNEVIIYTHK